MYKYVDYSKPPFIDISLPPAIVIPAIPLIILYATVLGLDFYFLYNERHFNKFISPKQLRIGMTIIHIIIPMIFISTHPPCNIFFAAVPWFIASYSAHMPTNQLTIEKWIYTLFKITIDDEEVMKNKTKIRCKGISKLSLGLFKFVFMHTIIDPLLPRRAEYALEYAWLSPMSLIYTVLFGIKAYCMLGIVDVFMGIEQAVFAWNMIDLFHSPIIASSPRDFWSRRWNRIVRNLLHSQVFKRKEEYDDDDATSLHLASAKPIESQTYAKKKPTKKTTIKTTTTIAQTTVTKRVTRSSTAAAAAAAAAVTSPASTDDDIDNLTEDELLPLLKKSNQKDAHDVMVIQAHHKRKHRSFLSTTQGRGLLSFIVSGLFHELIIMSACRKITLENFAFFSLQGLAVMIEVELRQGSLKQNPEGLTRLLCIALQLLFMSITGRLFTGPFLRYNFFQAID